jgi:hypothetical protein
LLLLPWWLLLPAQSLWQLWLHQQWLSTLLLPYHAQPLQHYQLLMVQVHHPQDWHTWLHLHLHGQQLHLQCWF